MKSDISPQEKRLLNAREAAEYLGLKEQTVRQWASMGKLPKVKLGGKCLRFDVVELNVWLDSQRVPAKTK